MESDCKQPILVSKKQAVDYLRGLLNGEWWLILADGNNNVELIRRVFAHLQQHRPNVDEWLKSTSLIAIVDPTFGVGLTKDQFAKLEKPHGLLIAVIPKRLMSAEQMLYAIYPGIPEATAEELSNRNVLVASDDAERGRLLHRWLLQLVKGNDEEKGVPDGFDPWKR